MIHSMLYATDLGLYAPLVMQHALALARTFNADLYVVHAVEPMGLFAESVLQSYLDEQALNEFHSQGLNTVIANIEQRVLDSFREELGGGRAGPGADQSGAGASGRSVAGDSRPGTETLRGFVDRR